MQNYHNDLKEDHHSNKSQPLKGLYSHVSVLNNDLAINTNTYVCYSIKLILE